MKLTDLPKEMVIQVLQYLSPEDLYRFSETCRWIEDCVMKGTQCDYCRGFLSEKRDLVDYAVCEECDRKVCRSCISYCKKGFNCEHTFCASCLINSYCDYCDDTDCYSENDSDDY